MKMHELKITHECFEILMCGGRNLKVRDANKDFKVGDVLLVKEWDGKKLTGREMRGCVKCIVLNKRGRGIYKIRVGNLQEKQGEMWSEVRSLEREEHGNI